MDVSSAFPRYAESDWRKAAEAALKGGSLEALQSKTADGFALAPLYGRRTGPRATRGRAGPWRVLTRIDHPEPGDASAQALEDLASGADGLQIVFAGATGAYGFGLAKGDAAALHRAFDGVRFDEGAALELDLGVDAEAEAKGVAALIARSGARLDAVDVSFGLDPLGLLIRAGRSVRSWPEDARALAGLVASLKGDGFRGPFASADARAIHAAGGTPAQELAFAIGAALSYLRALSENGFSPEAARDAIAFRMAADADEFATLAKFRALRLLWARVEDVSGLAQRPARIHAESAWRTMTARDPFVNVMRGALAAFSAGLGGADSVALLPLSQAIGLPDAFARRLARNTQLIELRESQLGFVADPAAGAGVFEALTQALCEKAWALFQAQESAGGLPAALQSGKFQQDVRDAGGALRRDVARLKAPITGVSAHPDLAEAKVEVLPATPVKFEFAGEGFAPPLEAIRLSEPFERVRNAADCVKARKGARPRVWLAGIGPASRYPRRIAYARELFEVGGLETSTGEGAADAAQVAAQFADAGTKLVCLCGTDESYLASAEKFALALRKAGVDYLLLAGKPPYEIEAAWRAAGIDAFIFAGCDALDILEEIVDRADAAI